MLTAYRFEALQMAVALINLVTSTMTHMTTSATFSFPAYDAKQLEPDIYQQWETDQCFLPRSDRASHRPRTAAPRADQPLGSFCIVIPPPNVTGSLHLGHAWDGAIQDILTRWQRMCGYNTLWLPGTDHAGIATQWMVERTLQETGTTKEALGREAFLEKVWAFKEHSQHTIINQLKRLGVSCDWSRERFTLDPMLSKAVKHVFVRLYEEGLIYRDSRMVNWSCKLLSAISDLEVEYREIQGELCHICYPFVDGRSANGEKGMVIATTRPETMLADGAVAVHPTDVRYAHLVGKYVHVPQTDRVIPIVVDEMVDPDFGSGAVKITPAHDPNDFFAGKRHNLLFLTIMDEEGVMNENAPPGYRGLERFEARKKVLAALEKEGLLIKREPHLHSVGHCSRSGSVIEPRVSEQWFLNMQAMAEAASAAIRGKKMTLVPQGQEKILFHWLDNIQDWCISRQLWWGHRIPVWYCQQCGAVLVSEDEQLSVCAQCGGSALKPETDVLDTWFSSGLWPFSTMGWPEQTADLNHFYPTSVLVTGYDILFFWVARMLMLGLKFTGSAPFAEVLLHGLLRDQQGQKMSKTKGNGLDPLELIDQYGADALRFALAAGTVPGKDMALSVNTVAGYRNFINKLWNLCRYMMLHTEAATNTPDLQELDRGLEPFDHWILSRLQETTDRVNRGFQSRRFDDACRALYAFVWHEFCDWYVEVTKLRLQNKAAATAPHSAQAAQAVLRYVLQNTLKLAHPIIPFCTEALWSECKLGTDFLMWEDFPTALAAVSAAEHGLAIDTDAVAQAAAVKSLIESIRNLRGENGINPAQRVIASLDGLSAEKSAILEKSRLLITTLGKLSDLDVNSKVSAPARGKSFARADYAGGILELRADWALNAAHETLRVDKERRRVAARIAELERKLSNAQFLNKAPSAVVEKNRHEHAELSKKMEQFKASA